MPLVVDDSAPEKFPGETSVTLNNFRDGVVTLVDPSRLKKTALAQAKNLILVEDGQPTKRPGVDWYGVAVPNHAEIDGFDYFDSNGVVHLVVVAGGIVYRSLDNGNTWDACTGGTTTIGSVANMNQNGAFLYITTGDDDVLRYDGTTTLQVYTVLTTPAAATIAATGLTGTSFTYYYKISAVNTVGFSAASTVVSKSVGLPRSGWSSSSDYLTLTLPAFQATQTRFDLYFSEDNINFFYLDSITTPNLVYKDAGAAVPVPSTLAPTDNTTKGPKVEELTNVGVRQYGVRDTTNRYRIWWTGGGSYSGSFSTAYDGGYIDWQPGGKYYPVKVVDYRDGKGSPLATVWCDSADGTGCILQISLDTVTIDTISITLPSAYQLPGSRGTNAPGSVVNVLNDYAYYNLLAFYNLGNRVNYAGLLSTDESSGNIRPTVRQINTAGSNKIASVYFEANIYQSVPMGTSTVNNYTMLYNTELKAWMPEAFTLGFKKFLRYTSTEADSSKVNRLLCVKPGDSRLSEISKNYTGDYGQAFETSLLTGLYQTTRDRFGFQMVENCMYEFSNPRGVVYLEPLGFDRTKGFKAAKLIPFQAESSVADSGWDTHAWDTVTNDDTTSDITVYSESSVKRYTGVRKELNNIQWHIFTNTIDGNYILRTLQTTGTDTQGGLPPKWRVAAQ